MFPNSEHDTCYENMTGVITIVMCSDASNPAKPGWVAQNFRYSIPHTPTDRQKIDGDVRRQKIDGDVYMGCSTSNPDADADPDPDADADPDPYMICRDQIYDVLVAQYKGTVYEHALRLLLEISRNPCVNHGIQLETAGGAGDAASAGAGGAASAGAGGAASAGAGGATENPVF